MFLKNNKKHQSGLSLIELLFVIVIISVLGTAAAIAINPVELFEQARDGRRIVDLQAINRALEMYKQDWKTAFGDANIVYVSLVDTASSACASHSLPSLPAGWSYRCVTSEGTLRRNNGTGWIPIDFTSISTGASIPALPVDPINSASSGFYYAYMTSGRRWALVSLLRSERYLKDRAATDGGTDPGRLEIGPDLSLWSRASGLVGWWTFDEGTGTSARDSSGINNHGTLVNSPTWTTGQVGGALSFNGTNNFVDAGNHSSLRTPAGTTFTYMAWIRGLPGLVPNEMFINRWLPYFRVSGNRLHLSINAGGAQRNAWGTTTLLANRWYHAAATYDASGFMSVFLDGRLDGVPAGPFLPISNQGDAMRFGLHKWGATESHFYRGLSDEIRIYNRVLSDAEIRAIHIATR